MNSSFYEIVSRALSRESKHLLAYTDALDADPQAKQAQIAEYKCAKYRYAAISNVHAPLVQSNRLSGNLADTHYVIKPFYEALLGRPELLAEYERAADKPCAGLYFGAVAFAEQKIAEFEDNLSHATDWEAIEPAERLGGYRFALECLHEGWKEAAK